ncbi:MAG: (4Fe-4S)-binding protein [Clostridiaceae bacterium BRH_c20a]|nr:MAG: (4Fe-4S)-binding protein [Clostridiaceae bacterium BRH_c20a]
MSSKSDEQKMDRRSLIKAGVTVGSGVLLASAIKTSTSVADVVGGKSTQIKDLPKGMADDEFSRMQTELLKALAKPETENHWIMVIDQRKCVGCISCTVACKAENALPPGAVYRPVIEHEIGTFPNVRRSFLPRPCMHCENPPCVSVCPVNATYKRPDGIVSINYERCIGCRYCLNACPYGARQFDWGEYYTENTPEIQPYEKVANYEYGIGRVREKGNSPIGNARKCHFCVHRIKKGMLPTCVTTCMGRATYFGDLNDKKSLVHELIGSARVMRLKEELGTKPSVYYLV